MARRGLQLAAALIACAAVLAQRPGDTSALRFGVIADVQYADKEPSGSRHYRSSLTRLKECVTALNERELDFVVQLGDFIDDGKDSFDAVLPEWKKLKAKRRSVIGNHDLPFARKLALAKLGLERGYYDFTVAEGFRFVVLDGMDVSLYGYAADHAKRREAARMLAALQKKGFNNAQRWNGAIGKQQLQWLDRTLADAAANRQRVVLLCHFPILAKASNDWHLLWNHAEVLESVEKHECVVAWFNGHHHAGGYAERKGIHHVTFAGMVEAAEQNAYAIVTVFADRLELSGFGKQKSRTLKLRPVAGPKKEKKN